ncbi:MAG: hypothetical protein ACLTXH_06450 [Enterobacter hormaechei]
MVKEFSLVVFMAGVGLSAGSGIGVAWVRSAGKCWFPDLSSAWYR